jgi:hypothetical protein
MALRESRLFRRSLLSPSSRQAFKWQLVKACIDFEPVSSEVPLVKRFVCGSSITMFHFVVLLLLRMFLDGGKSTVFRWGIQRQWSYVRYSFSKTTRRTNKTLWNTDILIYSRLSDTTSCQPTDCFVLECCLKGSVALIKTRCHCSLHLIARNSVLITRGGVKTCILPITLSRYITVYSWPAKVPVIRTGFS